MGLFTNELKGTTVVSIAHRAGMDAFHDRTLTLVDAVGGARLVTKRRPPPAPKSKREPRRSRVLPNLVLRRFRSAR
jgi:putative ATP-binding cassette transporter